jgi:predicted dehydrogenase
MLKIAVVGLGHLGKIHVKCIQMIDSYEIVGVYDTEKTVAEKVAKEYNITAFDNIATLIEAADVIDIVTPTTTHFELAKLVIAKGKHLFVEKPITHTLAEAEKLCRLAAQTTIKAQVGHVERFNPAFLAIENTSMQPMFAEVHRLALFNPRGTDVSVVLDLMIHDLDIILKLIPHPIRSVQASGVAIVSHTADICNARIEFENGAVVNLTASRLSMKNMRKLRIFQPDAYLSVDFLEKKTEVVRLHEKETDSDHPNLMELETAKGKRFIEIAMPEIVPNNAIKMELESLADSIINNTPTRVTLDDGRKALELAYWIIDEMKAHQERVK